MARYDFVVQPKTMSALSYQRGIFLWLALIHQLVSRKDQDQMCQPQRLMIGGVTI